MIYTKRIAHIPLIVVLIISISFLSGCATGPSLADQANQKLAELDRMRAEGRISDTDYWNYRKEIIDDFNFKRNMALQMFFNMQSSQKSYQPPPKKEKYIIKDEMGWPIGSIEKK